MPINNPRTARSIQQYARNVQHEKPRLDGFSVSWSAIRIRTYLKYRAADSLKHYGVRVGNPVVSGHKDHMMGRT